MTDPVVVSYGDSIIRLSELRILDTDAWLTDNVISFFFEYMNTTIFAQDVSRITFVGPNYTQLLKLVEISQVEFFIDGAQLSDKEFVFFPINDSSSAEYSGGTHWSLVVCNLRSNWCRHYDSSGGVNEKHARKLFNRLTGNLLNKNATYEEAKCQQQRNGFDCGVHVIVNARFLAEHYLTGESLPWSNSFDYTAMRSKLKYVICHASEGVDILY